MTTDRILRNKHGDEAHINLASNCRYAVALDGRIIQAPTVAGVREKAVALGWS